MTNKDVPHGTRETVDFITELKKVFAEGGAALTAGQAARMEAYYRLLVERNRAHNLTRITAPRDAAVKHFLDSVLPADTIPVGAKVVDVGSGAGFPAVPLKIMRDDVEMYALEASQKKCAFIRDATAQAGVGIQIINERAEEYARSQGREAFDVCVSRAVAPLGILLELCVPLVRVDGLFLAYKSGAQEQKGAEGAARQLGVSLKKELFIPLAEYEHKVLVYKKEKPTQEKYPRKYAKIAKSPL